MGDIEGNNISAMIARALADNVQSDEWIYLDRLRYLISVREGEEGNYKIPSFKQIREAIPIARRILETQSNNELTIEAKQVKLVETGKSREVTKGRNKGDVIPIMKKDDKGRVGLHVAYRIVRYKNSSRLFDNLEHKKKLSDGIMKGMRNTIAVALKQQAEIEGGKQIDFLKLLE